MHTHRPQTACALICSKLKAQANLVAKRVYLLLLRQAKCLNTLANGVSCWSVAAPLSL